MAFLSSYSDKHPAKTIDEVIDFFLRTFDVFPASAEDIGQLHNFLFAQNASHYADDGQPHFTSLSDLCIEGWILQRNEKSACYYDHPSGYVHHCAKDRDAIYVMVDRTTGFVSSNSSLLAFHLFLLKGVSAEDEKDDTLRYRRYWSYVQTCQEMEDL